MTAATPRDTPPAVRAWMLREPGRLIGKGHAAGDFLEAYNWTVLEEVRGHLRIRAHLPIQVKNPHGQLFGGFTPTYVDLVALFTRRAGEPPGTAGLQTWLATTSMRIDYFEPIVGPDFTIDSRLIKRRGRTIMVQTEFFDPADTLAVLALTTLRDLARDRPLGDG